MLDNPAYDKPRSRVEIVRPVIIIAYGEDQEDAEAAADELLFDRRPDFDDEGVRGAYLSNGIVDLSNA